MITAEELIKAYEGEIARHKLEIDSLNCRKKNEQEAIKELKAMIQELKEKSENEKN